MVDESFFVLKKCAERSFSSHNIATACAVINHVINTLSREFKDVSVSSYSAIFFALILKLSI